MIRRDPFSWRKLCAWLVVIVVLLAVVFGFRVSTGVESTPRGFILTPAECETFAEVIEQAVDARDARLGLRSYLDYLGRAFVRQSASRQVREIILIEVRRAYRAMGDAARIKQEAYTRCMSGPVGVPET